MPTKAKSTPSLPKLASGSHKRDQPETSLILEGQCLRKPSNKLSPAPNQQVAKPTTKTRANKGLDPIKEDSIHEDQHADVTKDVDNEVDRSSQSSIDLEDELRKADEILSASEAPKQTAPDLVIDVSSGSDSDFNIDEVASKKVPKPPVKSSHKRKTAVKKGSQAKDIIIKSLSFVPMSLWK